jgi:non-ribosomal peptide synthetase component F
MQNTPPQKLELAGLSLTPREIDSQTAKFDLTLSVGDAANKEQGLACSFEYNTDLFDHNTVGRMCSHFQLLLQGILANPERPLSTLPLMTEAERLQVLEERANTEKQDTDDLCIHQLFESQVQRTPDAVAAVCDDQQITYVELNHGANQVAHLLKKMDVGPGILVGLFLERSLDMVVALLGVLKAGGGYVPMTRPIR